MRDESERIYIVVVRVLVDERNVGDCCVAAESLAAVRCSTVERVDNVKARYLPSACEDAMTLGSEGTEENFSALRRFCGGECLRQLAASCPG